MMNYTSKKLVLVLKTFPKPITMPLLKVRL